jgi:hypothetical protein
MSHLRAQDYFYVIVRLIVNYCNFSSHPVFYASPSPPLPGTIIVPLPTVSLSISLGNNAWNLQTYFPVTFADWDRRRERMSLALNGHYVPTPAA